MCPYFWFSYQNIEPRLFTRVFFFNFLALNSWYKTNDMNRLRIFLQTHLIDTSTECSIKSIQKLWEIYLIQSSKNKNDLIYFDPKIGLKRYLKLEKLWTVITPKIVTFDQRTKNKSEGRNLALRNAFLFITIRLPVPEISSRKKKDKFYFVYCNSSLLFTSITLTYPKF